MAKAARTQEARPSRDWRQEATDTIVAALESGRKPWERPWDGSGSPVNAATGKRYRGINTLLLGFDKAFSETGDPRFCTFKQALANDWSVRKGSKSRPILFYKILEKRDKDADPTDPTAVRRIPHLQSFAVFHASEIDGIPEFKAPDKGEPWERVEAVHAILAGSGAVVEVGGDRAAYSPSADRIVMPPEKAFRTAEGWAATQIHELGHWTGHPTRLARDLSGVFGSEAYAREELRAEMASAFVCGEIGLSPHLENHASYVGSWLKVLKNDKNEIFRAASDAQKIADLCLSYHPGLDLDGVAPADEEDETPAPSF
jgi:antirestriction protein ArdC